MNKSLVKIVLFGMLAIACLWYISAPFSRNHTSAQLDTNLATYYSRIRDGVGTEVQFASRGQSIDQVRSSVDTVSTFIYNRSGMQLSSSIKEQLTQSELAVLNGKTTTINKDALINQLTDLTLARVSKMSDQEIDDAVDTLCGFRVPGTPANRNTTYMRTRTSLLEKVSPAELSDMIKALRDVNAQKIGRGFCYQFIQEQVDQRLKDLSAAAPTKFSKLWNKATETGELTPSQAVLVIYSIITDDHLTDNVAKLQSRMQVWYSNQLKTNPSAPSSQGFFAYGDNGYIYSTPLKTLFSTETLSQVLTTFNAGQSY